MKIFICEFITGGGLYREPLPPSLLAEGQLMRDAALRDFSRIAEIETVLTCDARLDAPIAAHLVHVVDVRRDIWALWTECIASVDVVLLIAPETNGVLEKLTKLAEDLNKVVLGSSVSAIRLAGDKWLSYAAFLAHDIPTVDTYLANALPNALHGAFVAKPRNGAGCDDMAYFEDEGRLNIWLQDRLNTHIVQPFQTGAAASFSMVCLHGKAYLLSANRQDIRLSGQHFSYHGGEINAMVQHTQAFDVLAQKIAQVMPGLAGYVGVDLIVDEDQFFVLEVNPRLTTSYVGLHQACGCNPAQLILDLFYNSSFIMPTISHRQVQISVNA